MESEVHSARELRYLVCAAVVYLLCFIMGLELQLVLAAVVGWRSRGWRAISACDLTLPAAGVPPVLVLSLHRYSFDFWNLLHRAAAIRELIIGL